MWNLDFLRYRNFNVTFYQNAEADKETRGKATSNTCDRPIADTTHKPISPSTLLLVGNFLRRNFCDCIINICRLLFGKRGKIEYATKQQQQKASALCSNLAKWMRRWNVKWLTRFDVLEPRYYLAYRIHSIASTKKLLKPRLTANTHKKKRISTFFACLFLSFHSTGRKFVSFFFLISSSS